MFFWRKRKKDQDKLKDANSETKTGFVDVDKGDTRIRPETSHKTGNLDRNRITSSKISDLQDYKIDISVDTALRVVADGIDDKQERSKALASIASELAKAGEIEKAREVFEKAIEVAERIDSESNRSWALRDIASELAKAGEVEGAREVFEKAIRVAERINGNLARSQTFSYIASELAKAGEIDKAKDVLDRAIQVAERIGHKSDRSSALASIVSHLAKAALQPKLLKLAEEYERKGGD